MNKLVDVMIDVSDRSGMRDDSCVVPYYIRSYRNRIFHRIDMRAKKADIMQAQIVEWYRACGYFVFDAHNMGDGFPDLVIVTPGGRIFLVEVKSGKNEKLTPAEEKFHREFPAHIPIVYDQETFEATLNIER